MEELKDRAKRPAPSPKWAKKTEIGPGGVPDFKPHRK